MTEDALKIDKEKTAFNARAKASMREYLKSRTWPEKIASIERMNEAAKMAREGMRRTRTTGTQGPGLGGDGGRRRRLSEGNAFMSLRSETRNIRRGSMKR